MCAAGLLLGWLGDQVLGDPRRGHPVAAFGALAQGLERSTYADTRTAGVLHIGLLVGGATGLGMLIERATPTRASRTLALAAATWAVLGARSLCTEGSAVAWHIRAGDLAAARGRVRSLVGRDPEHLDADDLARAVVESVAENTSDAVVAPLWWGAIAGIPGLLGYRAINTLDAMIGHHTPRLENFGWAAAKLDDAANWIPARLTALLTAVAAPLVAGSPATALDTARACARVHPSPNAGWAEAAFAGALGVGLGGVNHYFGRTEDRGRLGTGRTPRLADVHRATTLSTAVGLLAAAGAYLLRRGLRTRKLG